MIKTIATPNGAVHVEMTSEEIALRQAEETKFLSELPMKQWVQKIQETDIKLRRTEEDLIDAKTEEERARLPQALLDIYNQKKKIRSQKPE